MLAVLVYVPVWMGVLWFHTKAVEAHRADEMHSQMERKLK